ncbi:MAG TPA: hypothetical protein VMC09_03995 [Anaerolineales bacterium]|nr:hypothetical protein [Anaerolineales bacterium]
MKLSVRIAALLLVLGFLLAACGKTINTGIKGQAFLASCTGSDIAVGCSPQDPYPATLVIYDKDMKPVKTVKTAGDGTFTVALDPGTYFVHPDNNGKFPIAADFKVVVTEGKLTELAIYYDTGIR